MPFLKLSIAALFLFGTGFQCNNKSSSNQVSDIVSFASSTELDGSLVESYLRALSASPHPLGSERQKALATIIKDGAEELGLTSYTDRFIANVPNPILLDTPEAPSPLTFEKEGFNIYSFLNQSAPCTYFIASHYDSKFIEDFVYRGANDSGSSSAALFSLAKALKVWVEDKNPPCGYTFIWFDGEEAYLPQWSDGLLRHPVATVDNTYGSRFLAGQLVSCSSGNGLCLPVSFGSQVVKGMILLDMVGSPNLTLTRDRNSSADWLEKAISLDKELNLNIFGSFSTSVEDDHIPFKNLGLPVIDLIDFNHLQYWHKEGDDFENVDLSSIEKATRLALALALSINTSK